MHPDVVRSMRPALTAWETSCRPSAWVLTIQTDREADSGQGGAAALCQACGTAPRWSPARGSRLDRCCQDSAGRGRSPRRILPKLDQRRIQTKTPYPSKPIQPVHILAFAPAGLSHATFRGSLVVDCGSGLRGLYKSSLKQELVTSSMFLRRACGCVSACSAKCRRLAISTCAASKHPVSVGVSRGVSATVSGRPPILSVERQPRLRFARRSLLPRFNASARGEIPSGGTTRHAQAEAFVGECKTG